VDRINRRFPKAISVAATGFDKTWKAKAERISQRYTTDWQGLVRVKCA
jgi:DNA polymerase V